jgi:hypothetical protein
MRSAERFHRSTLNLSALRSAVGLTALRIGCAAALATATLATAEEPAPLVAPANRLAADAPAWRDLRDKFGEAPDITANFEEHRVFPFRRDAVVLKGEVRVSRAHGLSLHYLAPEERTIVVDEKGLLVREASGQKTAPADPRATTANQALLLVLRFDFAALEKSFELYGRRDGEVWSLGLVPRDASVRNAIGDLHVGGERATVRRIELRRSPKQHIDILIEPPRATTPFSADELARYFR